MISPIGEAVFDVCSILLASTEQDEGALVVKMDHSKKHERLTGVDRKQQMSKRYAMVQGLMSPSEMMIWFVGECKDQATGLKRICMIVLAHSMYFERLLRLSRWSRGCEN